MLFQDADQVLKELDAELGPGTIDDHIDGQFQYSPTGAADSAFVEMFHIGGQKSSAHYVISQEELDSQSPWEPQRTSSPSSPDEEFYDAYPSPRRERERGDGQSSENVTPEDDPSVSEVQTAFRRDASKVRHFYNTDIAPVSKGSFLQAVCLFSF